MFEFVINKVTSHEESRDIIERIESKYNIVFPEILKEYYIRHDGEMIEYCNLGTEDDPEIVSGIVALCDNSFEMVKDNCIEDGFIPDSFYPVAETQGGDYYFWDSVSNGIYFVYGDDIDNPRKISNSPEEFFERLSKSIW